MKNLGKMNKMYQLSTISTKVDRLKTAISNEMVPLLVDKVMLKVSTRASVDKSIHLYSVYGGIPVL